MRRAIRLLGPVLFTACWGLNAIAGEPPVGAACGPPAAVFMTLFTCPLDAHERLFGSTRTQRILSRENKAITAEAIRQTIATASGQPANMFEVSRGIFFVSNGPHPQAQQTAAGNGYALVISQVAPTAQVSLCAIAGGKMAGSVARAALKEDELLLARLSLDGAPYIMAICATIEIDDPKTHSMKPELVEAQVTFGKSLGKLSIKNPVAMKMTQLPPGAEDCLGSEASPDSSGH